MTCFAAPSSPRLIDMKVVEILVAVSEIRQGRGDLIVSDILLMAFKTQCIFVCAIGIIELCREELAEDLWIC